MIIKDNHDKIMNALFDLELSINAYHQFFLDKVELDVSTGYITSEIGENLRELENDIHETNIKHFSTIRKLL